MGRVDPKSQEILLGAYLDTVEEVIAVADGFRQAAGKALGHEGVAQLRLLCLLTTGEMNGKAPKELAARMAMARATCTRVLAGLAEAGFIEFGDFRGDRRCKSVWITEGGEAERERMIERLAPELSIVLRISRLRLFTDTLISARNLRKLQATSAAYKDRGPRRRPTMI